MFLCISLRTYIYTSNLFCIGFYQNDVFLDFGWEDKYMARYMKEIYFESQRWGRSKVNIDINLTEIYYQFVLVF